MVMAAIVLLAGPGEYCVWDVSEKYRDNGTN
jgi:hypothetical protein